MKTSNIINLLFQSLSKLLFTISVYLANGILFLLFAGLHSLARPELVQPIVVFAYLLMSVTILFLLYKLFEDRIQIINLNVFDILLRKLFLFLTINSYLHKKTWGFPPCDYKLIGMEILYILVRQIDKSVYLWFFVVARVSRFIPRSYGHLQLSGYLSSHRVNFKMIDNFLIQALMAVTCSELFQCKSH